MTKKIETLIEDIYALFDNDTIEVSDEKVKGLADALANVIKTQLQEKRTPRLSMSNFATPDRKLWYHINRPDLAEPIPPQARIKFLYGHVLEELVLFLADLAGHDVKGRQDRLHLNDELYGHRDAVIDGTLVDAKSANSRSFRKFKDGSLYENDEFGYIDQLNLYLEASQDDPLVEDKNGAYFLAIDKELGHLALLPIQRDGFRNYDTLFVHKKNVINDPEIPSDRCHDPVPDGKSGNMKLGVACSYCQFKGDCWPGMRTFLYSTGPRFLVHVEREPDVPELNNKSDKKTY